MTKKKFLVYVAGPISKGDLVANVMQAHEAAIQLMNAGIAVIVPHGSCFWGNKVRGVMPHDTSSCHEAAFSPEAFPSGIPHEAWIGMDLEIVGRMDGVLRLPGESRGADQEVAHANSLGIPVYYSVADVVAVADR